MAPPNCALYRPRSPPATPLCRLLQAHYPEVRDAWEDRFEGRYGVWPAFTDKAVGAYLDCGILELGFARVRCSECRSELLLAFSCKGRGLCPSCAAKRAAALAHRPSPDDALARLLERVPRKGSSYSQT